MGPFGCNACGMPECICHLFDQYDDEPREVSREDLDKQTGRDARQEDPMSDGELMFEETAGMGAAGAMAAGSAGSFAGAGARSEGRAAKKSGPGSRSVIVPADAIHARLQAAGFTEGRHGGEVIYTRQHARCTHLSVIIYTTLPARGGDTRGLGEDAIRIVAMFERLTPGRDRPFTKVVTKTARVFRTGSTEAVMERTIERAREAYAECNEFLKRGECFECCKKGGR